MADIIQVEGLKKTFRVGFFRKKVEAVRGVSFTVQEGEVFGLIGPNGAGKTTTIKMLTGLVRPDEGTASIAGFSSQERRARAHVGYLPENPYFYEHLTARELLTFYGQLQSVPTRKLRTRVEELIERVGLDHAADRPLKKFSKGMRQRAGLAQALLNDPQVVILDEPQSGLDPRGRKDVRDLIYELKRNGKTVLFASHILPDVEEVCDRVAVMHFGEVREVGALRDLTSSFASMTEINVRGISPDALPATVELIEEKADALLLRSRGELSIALSALLEANAEVVSVVPREGSLEDVFLRDTQESP